MSLLVKHDVVDIPLSYYADTLEEAKLLAEEAYKEYVKKGFLVTLDTDGTEVRPGLFGYNIYVKNKTYR